MSVIRAILKLLGCDDPQPQPVDLARELDGRASMRAGERLDWRHSVVDLLKLLNLDSSIETRLRLADELHYPGNKNATGAMNVWLHKEIMRRVADNGGIVPSELM